jgi:hypothetical protein
MCVIARVDVMSDEPASNEPNPDEWTISVRSYELLDPRITDPVVHEEIVFSKGGEVVFAFNGDGRDREEGIVQFPAKSGETTLRARITEMSLEKICEINGTSDQLPLLREDVLLRTTDTDQVALCLARAAEAAEFINSQDLDYVMIGDPFHTSQNSNSVAHTLATAMGLDYSPEGNGVWAPGHDRILLPSDWKSSFDANTSLDQMAEYFDEAIVCLGELGVQTQIKVEAQDRDPNESYKVTGESFFDRDNPKPYSVGLQTQSEEDSGPADAPVSENDASQTKEFDVASTASVSSPSPM